MKWQEEEKNQDEEILAAANSAEREREQCWTR